MKFRRLKKKILAMASAAALSISLTFGAPVASASTFDLVTTGISIMKDASEAKAKIDAQIKHLDETEEGRQELYQSFRQKTNLQRVCVYPP